MQGEGELTLKDQTTYRGQFFQGYYHGDGHLVYPDLSEVRGKFVHGILFGAGVFKYPPHEPQKKEEFIGEFKNGKPHGKGTLKFLNGTMYNGEFEDGLMCGEGKLAIASEKTEISNNECYVGEFKDNLYDGYGEYMSYGFIVYKGYWRKGKRHGKGQFRENKDDKFLEGIFCDGNLLQTTDNFKLLA